jgi:hypothetical protein
MVTKPNAKQFKWPELAFACDGVGLPLGPDVASWPGCSEPDYSDPEYSDAIASATSS